MNRQKTKHQNGFTFATEKVFVLEEKITTIDENEVTVKKIIEWLLLIWFKELKSKEINFSHRMNEFINFT